MKAAGQYAGLEDDGFFINHEAPASQGGTMPTLFSTTGLDVTKTGKAPARKSGGSTVTREPVKKLLHNFELALQEGVVAGVNLIGIGANR